MSILLLCSTFIHLLYTTAIPFSFAFLSASLLYIPDFIQITFIPFFFIASSTTGGTSSDLLNTSTTSTCSAISEILAYDFLPSTSFVVGFTGITLYPFSIRYFGTKLAGFPSVFDIPITATFFILNISRISDGECESVLIIVLIMTSKQLSPFNVSVI